MVEIGYTTLKANPHVDPVLSVWGWEVPVYLFLGGLAAGLLVLASSILLLRREKDFPAATGLAVFLAPVLVSLGMGALFLDLARKAHVWRFYTTFEVSSPMSWGAWVLLLIYPLNVLMMAGVLRAAFPGVHAAVLARGGAWVARALSWAEEHLRTVALWTLVAALVLGVYTGILLSANVSRPFWNVALLGPLFLVSGISTAMALVMLLTRDDGEYAAVARMDLFAVLAELLLLFLFGFNMLTSTQHQRESMQVILGGSLTAQFWVWFVGLGLLLPLFLEWLEMKRFHVNKHVAPALILFGGLVFRVVVVNAGQLSSWAAR